MKKFAWRLQRVLDIRIRQEEAARKELLELSERLAQMRQELLVKQAGLRELLGKLAQEEPAKRLNRQQLFMKSCESYDRMIRGLKKQIAEMDAQKKVKLAGLLKLSRFRKALEKLRSYARARFNAEQEKLEQKQLDESATLSFAREMAEAGCKEQVVDPPELCDDAAGAVKTCGVRETN